MILPDRFLSALFGLPTGTSSESADSRYYVASHQVLTGGKSHKLVAHDPGRPDYISLNLDRTQASGALLRPSEMPAGKVTAFVLALTPDVHGVNNFSSRMHSKRL